MHGSAQWRKKSTYCDTASCVEVATAFDGIVGVRDGKDASGPVLTFFRAGLACLRRDAQAQEYELNAIPAEGLTAPSRSGPFFTVRE